MGMTLDSHYLQPMPPYGVLLLGKGRGILLPRAFNQRTQYGVLPLRFSIKSTYEAPSTNAPSMGCFNVFVLSHKFDGPSTNAPSMGCFAILSCFLTRLLTFNQRTQYGVLRVLIIVGKEVRPLQPTHPVWGASCQRESDYPLYEPSTNAPSMGCFGPDSKPPEQHPPFNQRTQYGVLPLKSLQWYHM